MYNKKEERGKLVLDTSPSLGSIDRSTLRKVSEAGTLNQYLNVVYALVMHDIKTRFFGTGIGQIVMVIWPLVHIVALLLIFRASGRIAPYGESTALYCATGVMPFIIWSYMSRWMVYSTVQNNAYTKYPIVKVLDLIVARAILETITYVIVVTLTILILLVFDVECWPKDVLQASFALGASFLLAFGTGMFNAVIATIFPLWITIFTLFIIVSYAASGILFIPSSLPEEFRTILAYNPLLQLVEWMRSAYYQDYPRLVLDRAYAVEFGFFAAGLGLILETVLRPYRRE